MWIFWNVGWEWTGEHLSEALFAPLMQGVALAQVFLISNIVVLVFNLYPRYVSTEAGQVRNDGLTLLGIFKMSPADVQKLYASYYVANARQLIRRKRYAEAKKCLEAGLLEFPQSEHLLYLQGFVLIHERDYSGARHNLIKILANASGKSFFRLLLLNGIAYADALIGDAFLLDEADRYSEEAWEQASWEPSFNGTRGLVLVEKGQLEEGIALLKIAFQTGEEIGGKAVNACHLSIAEKKRGNLAESERYLRAARELDPDCPLLQDLNAKS